MEHLNEKKNINKSSKSNESNKSSKLNDSKIINICTRCGANHYDFYCMYHK